MSRVSAILTASDGPTGSIVMIQLARVTTKPATTSLSMRSVKIQLLSLLRPVPLDPAPLHMLTLSLDSGVTMMNRSMENVPILRFDSAAQKRLRNPVMPTATNGLHGWIVMIQLEQVTGKTRLATQQMLFAPLQLLLRLK